MSYELLTKTQLEAWNSSFEISKLRKDKERLDWLIDNASISMLRKDEDGREWWVELDYSEPREDIDQAMEDYGVPNSE